MKFFTPQLMERFGSSDPEIADQADAQWEQAGDRYDAYLTQIEPDLPPGNPCRRRKSRQPLHDVALVTKIGGLRQRRAVPAERGKPAI